MDWTALLSSLFCLFLLTTMGSPAFANSLSYPYINSITDTEYLEDSTGKLSLKEVQGLPFKPYTGNFSIRYSTSVIWFRLTINSGLEIEEGYRKLNNDLILAIKPATIEEVKLYDPFDMNNSPRVTGSNFLWDGTEYQHMIFGFVIPRSPQPRTVLIRVKTDVQSSVIFTLTQRQQLVTQDHFQLFVYGAYFTIFIMVISWSSFALYIRREKVLVALVLKQVIALLAALTFFSFQKTLIPNHLSGQAMELLLRMLNAAFISVSAWFFYELFCDYNPNRTMKQGLRNIIFLGPFAVILILAGYLIYALWLIDCLTVLLPAFCLFIVIAGINWKGRAKKTEVDNNTSRRPISRLTFIVVFFILFVLSLWSQDIFYDTPFWRPKTSLYAASINGLVAELILMILMQVRFVKINQIVQTNIALTRQKEVMENHKRDEQSRLISMLTHELKSPLATVSMAANAMIAAIDEGLSIPVNMQKAKLQRIDVAARDINIMIERCIEVDKVDMKKEEVSFAYENLAAIICDLIADFNAGGSPKYPIIFAGPPSMMVYTDAEILRIVFRTLIGNALKYGDKDASVEIDLSLIDGDPYISVKNKISEFGAPDVDQVFKKFYRSKLAAVSINGSGVGLWLAKSLIESRGGSLQCFTNDEYVAFTIHLDDNLARTQAEAGRVRQ